MAKNVVICCDGTGNEYGQNNSNVVKLCFCLATDVGQAVYYHAGLGTMGAPNAGGRLAKGWSRLCGLGFGAGLLDNVSDAYRFLMDTYVEGDRVFLFGFSRGAYTVRVLAAILHMYGLLQRGNQAQIPYITRMFAQKTRARGRFQREILVAQGFKSTFSRDVAIDFIGVWDTVSSVGWIYDPVKLPYTANNPSIRVGRHAVSIDERRCFYRDNLLGKAGPGQDLRQVWFAGVHSDVGGSYPELQSGLSKITLEWMLSEGVQKGLRVQPSRRTQILGGDHQYPEYVQPDAGARLHRSLHGFWWLLEILPHRYYDWTARAESWRVPLGAPRTIPEGATIHGSVLARMRNTGAHYRALLPPVYQVESGGNTDASPGAVESRMRRISQATVTALRITLQGPGVALALATAALGAVIWLPAVADGHAILVRCSLPALFLRFLIVYVASSARGGFSDSGVLAPEILARASAWAGSIAVPGGLVGYRFGSIDAGTLCGGAAGILLGEIYAWRRRTIARRGSAPRSKAAEA
jgi:hypothetical protein